MAVLLDREAERAAIEGVLAAAREGMSGALVLRGEAGIGKTALLEHAAGAADGFAVLRLVGIESEVELGFAALHQLLRPSFEEIDTLPAPQRDALSAAFGLADTAGADRMLVGLGCLTLLSELASERPLLCLVDDAQWLDEESAVVLAFVARRLHADRIAMVFAVREPTTARQDLDGLDEVRVGGLPEADARALLGSVVDGRLEEADGDRVVAETGGNPLALVELGAALGAEEVRLASLLPEPLPLSRRLEVRFLRQVRVLPAETQALLLLAAADPTGDEALLWRAGEQLGVDHDAAAGPAVAADLLSLRPRVSFRHPLIRSAVYHGALPSDRRRAHMALGEATDPEVDADRRAWHRAAAVGGRDETVAGELERAAAKAQVRGGYAGAAAMLTRAAELSGERRLGAARLLAAAEAEVKAGAPARAQRLLEECEPDLDEPALHARAVRLRGAILYVHGQAQDAARTLVDAARALRDHDHTGATEALLEALSMSASAQGGLEVEIAEAALAHLAAATAATPSDLLLEGLATVAVSGHAAAAPALRRGLSALEAHDCPPDELVRSGIHGGVAAAALGEHEAMHRLATRLIELPQLRGGSFPLAAAALLLGTTALVAGRPATAEAAYVMAHGFFAREPDLVEYPEVLVLGWKGPEDLAREREAVLRRQAEANGHRWVLKYLDWALGVLELGVGNYAAALERLRRIRLREAHLLAAVHLPDLVEAASRCGALEVARSALADYERWVEVSGTSMAIGQLARARALLAEDDSAEALYRSSLDELGTGASSGLVARTHLVFGEWLRRQRRRREAREHLRAAQAAFEAAGASFFAGRAAAELRATGETARRRAVETQNELTPQERRITELAAAGATNPEIAAQLYISAATVEYHLRKVFQKLGIRSRRELARTSFAVD